MKNSSHIIGDRNRDRPAYSAVTQPTAPPPALQNVWMAGCNVEWNIGFFFPFSQRVYYVRKFRLSKMLNLPNLNTEIYKINNLFISLLIKHDRMSPIQEKQILKIGYPKARLSWSISSHYQARLGELRTLVTLWLIFLHGHVLDSCFTLVHIGGSSWEFLMRGLIIK